MLPIPLVVFYINCFVSCCVVVYYVTPYLVSLQKLQNRSLCFRQDFPRTKVEEPMPVLIHKCLLSWQLCLSYTCPSLSSLFSLIKSALYPYPKVKHIRPVNTHQCGMQCTDYRTKTSLNGKKEVWWNGGGAYCFDEKSFSFLSVLGQVHCHHSRVT